MQKLKPLSMTCYRPRGDEQVGAKPTEYLSNIGIDTRGEAKLAGESAVCGKWRGALAMRLELSTYNLHCARVSLPLFVARFRP